jgi:hypothetical protein
MPLQYIDISWANIRLPKTVVMMAAFISQQQCYDKFTSVSTSRVCNWINWTHSPDGVFQYRLFLMPGFCIQPSLAHVDPKIKGIGRYTVQHLQSSVLYWRLGETLYMVEECADSENRGDNRILLYYYSILHCLESIPISTQGNLGEAGVNLYFCLTHCSGTLV